MARETIKHGVDVEQYPKFIEHATRNPDDVMLGLGARGVAEGRAMHTHARVGDYDYGDEAVSRETRQYTFQLGAFRELEADAGFVDPGDRPEPVEVALAGLTGCINSTLDVIALENGIKLDDLETDVNVSLDPRAFFGIEDAEQLGDAYDDVAIDIAVRGPDLSEKDVETLREGVARSPVFNLFSREREMTPEVRLKDAPKMA